MRSRNEAVFGRCVALCAGALLVMSVAAPAGAEEVIVQNDTYTVPPAGLEANFAPGEQAGVLLTSPCDGAIVALQVGWASVSGLTGFSFERNIWVYADAGTFPMPGSVLAQLEGPVLNDGAINEYRYYDDNQTVPINIPVTAGQKFYVALEFDNWSYPGSGDACVFHDIDTCEAGKNVLYSGGWWNICLLGWSGNTVIRAVIDCQEPTGACCHATGICEPDLEEGDCQAFGDVWHEALTCGEITCNPRGACCVGASCLTLVPQSTCEGIGDYAGHGTDCADDVCEEGACCNLLTGECTLNFGFQCDALGPDYEYKGPFTACDPNPCAQPTGACCIGEVCVEGQTEQQCIDVPGVWVGPWTDCGPPNPCLPDPCDSVTYTLCDVNNDTKVDGNDVQDFVAEYLTPTPPSVAFCAANACGGPELDADDLNDFILCLLDPTGYVSECP
ncbi:MAG: hypothetical protein ABII12_01380 [Planctomycetota bacterium]